MSIKRTIIVTAAIAASVAMVAPTFAGAVTIDELLAQITALQGQLLALQGAPAGGSGTGACAGVTFTRNLTVGSTGSDVKCLQVLLNGNGFTVATTGAGSPGSETTYFGSKTLVAVKAFQASKGWTPANQVGPMTRQALNALIGGGNLPPIIPTGAGLTVQLASNNPAAGTLVETQGLAPLAKITFVNGDSSEVKVTSVKLKRIGISTDSTLSNVYLFDGARRLTDSASVASTIITFNDSTGIFTVPAGSSKTISVLSDIANTTTGQTVGVQLLALTDISTNASSVKGVFPVTGNLFTIAADPSDMATVYMADASGTVSPSTASIDPQNDYAIWYDSAVIGNKSVYVHRIAFRVGGSVNRATDIRNFRLLIDGVQQGSAVSNADANDYVTFDLSAAPVRLETGTRVVKVLADIIGGSNKNVYLSLRTAADATFVDSQLNVGLTLYRVAAGTAFSVEDSGTQSINSGTLTVTKLTTSPSGNVVDLANNATLAKYELKAAGERVKIESLRVSATISDAAVGSLRNGAVYANGVQVGSTATLNEDSQSTPYTTYNFGSSLIVEPGSPVTLEVRADIYDNDGTNTSLSGDTILIKIVGGDLNNAYGMVSMATVDVPASSVSANTLTVATGSITLSKYTAYTDQNAVVPLTDYKLAHYTLTGSTTEAININTIEVGLNYVSGNTSNLYVKFGNNTTAIKSTVGVSNTWSVNYTLAAGTTVDVMVFGNVDSSAAGVAVAGMYIAGTTASSATAVSQGTTPQTGSSTIAGQTITFTSGTWASAVDGGTPVNAIVAGGQTVIAAKFKLTASNDAYTVKEVRFTVANAATSAVISSLTLKGPDGVGLATVPYDSVNALFPIASNSGIITIPANTSKVITVELNLVAPYTDGTTVTTGKNAAVTMSYLKIANSQGTETTPTTSKVGNYVYAFKSVPTLTVGTIAGQGTALSAGSTVELYKFTAAAASNGPIALKQVKFTATVTDPTGTDGSFDTLKFFRGSSDITSSVTIQNTTGGSLESTTANVSGSAFTIIVTFDTEETITSPTSFTLKGTASNFACASGTCDSVTVSIPTDTTPAGVSAGAAHARFYLDATASTAIQTLFTSAAGAGTGTAANVIWSDNSAQSHNYTYTGSSADWFNGYLVLNLPLDAIGSVAQ